MAEQAPYELSHIPNPLHFSFSDFLFVLVPVKFLIPGDESQGVKGSTHTYPVQMPGLTLVVSEWESQ